MRKVIHYLSLAVFTNCYPSYQIRPVPWITEDAIHFLEEFLDSNENARVLEFGCGASTIWLAQRTKNLVSIEHDHQWYQIISNELKKNEKCYNVNLILKNTPYNSVCKTFPDGYFDLILIDGRNRKRCLQSSKRILKKGGILMLDNAERSWYQCAIKQLLSSWQFHRTIQTKPDSCNFWYENWQTNWWIKPH